jgi:sulfur-oxidizing protein SoxB
LIQSVRKPYTARLEEPLAITDGLLYRRGNFNGSWDQLVCNALMDVLDAPIALSPGFRWGTTLLPGAVITRESMMDQLAITYPAVRAVEMTGAQIKVRLEDAADNLFNPDPYYQQGGDMVRVGGLVYSCQPDESMGHRISDMRLNGKPIQASRRYKVAGWASVSHEDGPSRSNPPVWQVVEDWLKAQPGGHVRPVCVNHPRLLEVQDNAGVGSGEINVACGPSRHR